MSAVLIFSVLLVFAVLLSARFERTLLSAATLFLVGGILSGGGVFGVTTLEPQSSLVSGLTRAALVTILFTDAMNVSLGELAKAWRLPGRALLLGLPLTVLGLGLLAQVLLRLPTREAFLIGAILSPTDPVLSSAVVGRESIPRKLRDLLNIESGVNDGLALPIVLSLMPGMPAEWWRLVLELAGGILVGICVPWLVLALKSRSVFEVGERFAPYVALAIGLCTFAVAVTLHVSEFLAAFSGGVATTSLNRKARADFARLGELTVPLMKVATIFVFGILVSNRLLGPRGMWRLAFAALAILVVRPLSILFALVGSRLERPLRLIAAWFGPKGFASILFSLLLFHSAAQAGATQEHAEPMFSAIALVVVCSILAHSSTDVPIAHWLERRTDLGAHGPEKFSPDDR